jgi:peptidoglycan/xylan/chitin deacetylase (PgdA/CDA1 family)
MRSILLSGLKQIATLSSGLGRQKKLFILIYHRVLDEPHFMRPGEVDKSSFSWQMELLATYFNVLPLHEALQHLENDTLPPRAVTITFDDGYADNLYNALPILKQYHLTATFFIASGYLDGGRMWNDSVIEAIRLMETNQLDLTDIGLGSFDISSPTHKTKATSEILNKIKHLEPLQRNECAQFIAAKVSDLPNDLMLTTEQLKQLHKAGVEIGGHTVTHPILARMTDNEAMQEIAENKKQLEQILGEPIRYFAYPNGKPVQDYLPKQIDFVKQSGYFAALSTQPSVASKASDLWQLPRFTPWDKSPTKFMARMIRLFAKN